MHETFLHLRKGGKEVNPLQTFACKLFDWLFNFFYSFAYLIKKVYVYVGLSVSGYMI